MTLTCKPPVNGAAVAAGSFKPSDAAKSLADASAESRAKSSRPDAANEQAPAATAPRGWIKATGDSPGSSADRGEDEADFSWSDDDVVVLRPQQAVAIYRNPRGDLVIRQERTWSEHDDPFIVICRNNEQEFLDRLCDFLDVPSIRP
ncbi:MAG: hypothetical protein U1E81_08140 [Xanthobacteraceae bacterium]